MSICSIKDCQNKYYAKGYCEKHYQRVRDHGESFSEKFTHASPAVRFRRFFTPSDEQECWPWLGTVAKSTGYGSFAMAHRLSISAHKAAYIFSKGIVPDGLFVMHSCDNRACVNPNHLSLGTHKDNMADMRNKGRKWSRLKEDDVRYIRSCSEKSADLARKYGVYSSVISNVRNFKSWKEVK